MIYWCVKHCILEEDNIPESAFCLAVKIQFLFSVSVIQLSRSENLQTTLESDWIRRMSQNDAVAIRELPTVFAKKFHLLHQRLHGMNTLTIRTDINVIEWRTPKNAVHILLNELETSFLRNCMCTIALARQWCLHSGEICVFPKAVTCLFKHTKTSSLVKK